MILVERRLSRVLWFASDIALMVLRHVLAKKELNARSRGLRDSDGGPWPPRQDDIQKNLWPIGFGIPLAPSIKHDIV